MAKKGGLGKGLSALVEQTVTEAGVEEGMPVVELDVALVHRNPGQPRVYFDQDDLQELSDSIKNVGVLQPILVRKDQEGYEIVAGERRYQAACMAGLKDIPAIVREMSDVESLEIALIENIQRSNLNSIEEARAYRDLLEKTGMTQDELGKKIAKSRSTVTNVLRLLDLPEEVQNLVFDGSLSAGHARAILGASSDEKRIMIAKKVAEEKLSVRQTESLVALFSMEQSEKSPRPTVPHSFKKVAKRLREDLRTNVKIKQVKGTYKIEIDFNDEDDLNRLLSLIDKEGR